MFFWSFWVSVYQDSPSFYSSHYLIANFREQRPHVSPLKFRLSAATQYLSSRQACQEQDLQEAWKLLGIFLSFHSRYFVLCRACSLAQSTHMLPSAGLCMIVLYVYVTVSTYMPWNAHIRKLSFSLYYFWHQAPEVFNFQFTYLMVCLYLLV